MLIITGLGKIMHIILFGGNKYEIQELESICLP